MIIINYNKLPEMIKIATCDIITGSIVHLQYYVRCYFFYK